MGEQQPLPPPKELVLANETARLILSDAGITAEPSEVVLLKKWNHVWRIDAGESFFLKAHTKDWYSHDPAFQKSVAADQEVEAYSILSRAGLAVPDVVSSDDSFDNHLGEPFLLLRELGGDPFVDLVSEGDRRAALKSVGDYLAAMHKVTFSSPGYLAKTLRDRPREPGGWQHPIWAFEPFRDAFDRTLEVDAAAVSGPVLRMLRSEFAEHEEEMRESFTPPRFVHGDCHAHQFFAASRDGSMQVTGVLDMEVASSGNPVFDFVKFGIEMAGRYSEESRWWIPLFEGYGREPSFDLVKSAMLAAEHINYTCLGPFSWSGTREDIVTRLLASTTWEALYASANK